MPYLILPTFMSYQETAILAFCCFYIPFKEDPWHHAGNLIKPAKLVFGLRDLGFTWKDQVFVLLHLFQLKGWFLKIAS